MAREATVPPADALASRSPSSQAMRRLLRHRLAMAGLAVVVVIATLAIFAPLVTRFDPAKQDYNAISEAPNGAHWFGTDQLGRDAFSRVVYGARTSLVVGLATQLIVLAIGLPIGAIAGYLGRRADNLIMRSVDVIYAFPDLLFIILLRSVFGGSVFMVFLAIGIVSWTTIARLARAQVLALKEMEYVKASHAVGAGPGWVLTRHILPNAWGPIIVAVTFAIPRAIFAEAALSYIGIGVKPPTASWGSMIQDGYAVVFAAPHLVLFPALAIALVMLAFTFIGDGLRDALDPRG